MPFGHDRNSWQALPPAEQLSARSNFMRVEAPFTGGAGGRKERVLSGADTAEQTVTVTTPPEVNWYVKRRLDWFPQDAPNYPQLRQLGIGGIMSESQSPSLATELVNDRQAGFLTGVWYPPPIGITPEQACAETVAAAQAGKIDALGLDVEFVGKGYPPGSPHFDPAYPNWDWNKRYADCVRAHLPDVPLAVLPMPNQDDFNYGAYADNGSVVWVQCYGETFATLWNPVEMVKKVHGYGIPYSRIGALLAPVQLPEWIGPLQALGVSQIAVYGTDGLTPEVVSSTTPFPADGKTGATVVTVPTAPPTTDTPVAGVGQPSPVVEPSPGLPFEPSEEPRAESFDGEPLAEIDTLAVEDSEVDLTSWIIDGTVFIEEDDINEAGTRELEGGTVASRGPFPSWCAVPHGGYVQGVTGPVGTGIRQLELIIGTKNVYNDFAATGHAKKSDHKCGGAMDIRATVQFWDFLIQHNSALKLLLGPWGLYNYGVAFHNAKTAADHKDHIHVSTYLSAAEIRRIFHVVPGTGVPGPGGTRGPTVPQATPVAVAPSLEQGWEALAKALSTQVPRSINRVAGAREQLHATLRKR